MQTDHFDTILARFLDQSARHFELSPSGNAVECARQTGARARLALALRNAGRVLPSKPAWIL